MPVVISNSDEREAELGLAPHRPGRIARQNIDFAVAQRLKPGVGGERNELDLVGVAEDRGRDRAAEIDVETGPDSRVRRGMENPGSPSLTPQIKDPRALTSAKVCDAANAEAPTVIANRNVERAHLRAPRPDLLALSGGPMRQFTVDPFR